MQIDLLELQTSEPIALREFYERKMEMKVIRESKSEFSIEVGKSLLKFREARGNPYYHFAFNIPSDGIRKAVKWLKNRVAILQYLGNDIVRFEDWLASSVYFEDPAGNIVELIARESLNTQLNSEFNHTAILSISEIGIVVDNIRIGSDYIMEQCAIRQYRGNYHSLNALGDENGLFIVVDEKKKKWFPKNKDCLPFDLNLAFRLGPKRFKMHLRNNRLTVD